MNWYCVLLYWGVIHVYLLFGWGGKRDDICVWCVGVSEVSGESGEESSCEDDVQIPIKHKPLQARHSLLDDLDEGANKPSTTTRQKRTENLVSSIASGWLAGWLSYIIWKSISDFP